MDCGSTRAWHDAAKSRTKSPTKNPPAKPGAARGATRAAVGDCPDFAYSQNGTVPLVLGQRAALTDWLPDVGSGSLVHRMVARGGQSQFREDTKFGTVPGFDARAAVRRNANKKMCAAVPLRGAVAVLLRLDL